FARCQSGSPHLQPPLFTHSLPRRPIIMEMHPGVRAAVSIVDRGRPLAAEGDAGDDKATERATHRESASITDSSKTSMTTFTHCCSGLKQWVPAAGPEPRLACRHSCVGRGQQR